MRQIVLDTETTGMSPKWGDRIVEIGCVELISRQRTFHDFHVYINPGRPSSADALTIHGLTEAFLSDKPKFAETAEAFCDYVRGGAELIIHNAPFDLRFLDAELAKVKLPSVNELGCKVTDTLALARRKLPGAKSHKLDALCEHYGIDESARSMHHGALIDAELLVAVYLKLTHEEKP